MKKRIYVKSNLAALVVFYCLSISGFIIQAFSKIYMEKK